MPMKEPMQETPGTAHAQGRREASICAHVVKRCTVSRSGYRRRFAGDPFVLASNIRFYAGMLFRTATDHAVGTLCMIDRTSRILNARDVKLL
jgi:hypothetical protein